MKFEDIAEIGATMSVEFKDINTNTKLQEIVEEDSFVVFQPTYGGGVPLITRRDALIEFSFVHDCALYVFNASLEKTFVKDKLVLSRYKIKSELIKIQRRESFRLDIRLGAQVKVITEEEGDETVRTIDISEGGMKFESFKLYEMEQILKCEVFLQDNRAVRVNNLTKKMADVVEDPNVQLLGEVVRTEKCKDDNKISEISIKFLNVSKEQQEKIRKFVVKQQLIIRRRLR